MAWDYDAWLQNSDAYDEFCGLRDEDDQPDWKEDLESTLYSEKWTPDKVIRSRITGLPLPQTYRKVLDHVQAEITVYDSYAEFAVALKDSDEFILEEELDYDEDVSGYVVGKVLELEKQYA